MRTQLQGQQGLTTASGMVFDVEYASPKVSGYPSHLLPCSHFTQLAAELTVCIEK